MIKRTLILVAVFAFAAAAQTKSSTPTANSPNDALISKTETYLRVLFGWGPDYKVKLGPVTQSLIPDLEQVPVSVTHEGHEDTGIVYVTKDGHFMARGEIRDMTKDPFAENLPKLKLGDSPALGPANAEVTVVEFSDLECPHCQQVYSFLKLVEPEFPQVRFVYKNFPLEQIHPWAMTAALAGRCVYKTSNAAFLKFQGTIFDNQGAITADNAWDQISAAAVAAGVSADALHSCMTLPETKSAVEADLAEGKALNVESTPTFFINGRPFIAQDRQSLEQIIRFELSRPHLKPQP